METTTIDEEMTRRDFEPCRAAIASTLGTHWLNLPNPAAQTLEQLITSYACRWRGKRQHGLPWLGRRHQSCFRRRMRNHLRSGTLAAAIWLGVGGYACGETSDVAPTQEPSNQTGSLAPPQSEPTSNSGSTALPAGGEGNAAQQTPTQDASVAPDAAGGESAGGADAGVTSMSDAAGGELQEPDATPSSAGEDSSSAAAGAAGQLDATAGAAGQESEPSGGSGPGCEDPEPVILGDFDTGRVRCGNGVTHRAESVACRSELPRQDFVPPDPDTLPGAMITCTSDEDCTDRPYGYCQVISCGGCVPGTQCAYGCVENSDCDAGDVCDCGQSIGTCRPATCSSTADCEEGMLCAQWDATPFVGCPTMISYACQSPDDECISNADCEGDHCEVQDGVRQCTPYVGAC